MMVQQNASLQGEQVRSHEYVIWPGDLHAGGLTLISITPEY
jgi:hypothetical protein